MSHSWVLARIAMIFKTVEFTLARIEGTSQPNEWQTFLAGCVAGYSVMVSMHLYLRLKHSHSSKSNCEVGVLLFDFRGQFHHGLTTN